MSVHLSKVSSSRVYRLSLVETVIHQAAQFGFLNVPVGNVLGQVGLLSGFIFCESTA